MPQPTALRRVPRLHTVVVDITKKRPEWIGRVVRMDQGRMVKEIFDSKPEGIIGRIRPRLICQEDTEKVLREMKIKRWRKKAVDRDEWESENKEAKAVRGP